MKTTVQPHVYQDDPDAPGTCVRCGRADPKRTNRVHQLPDLTEHTEESRRRAGDTLEDE